MDKRRRQGCRKVFEILYFSVFGRNKVFGKFRRQRSGKREAQKVLAKEVTIFVHGEEASKRAQKITENLFAGKIKDLDEKDLKEIFTDSSVVKLENFPAEAGLNIVDFLVHAKVADSKRQTREDVQNKAIEINGNKITETDYLVSQKDLLFGQYLIAKRGRGIISLFPYNHYLIVSGDFYFVFRSWRRILRRERLL